MRKHGEPPFGFGIEIAADGIGTIPQQAGRPHDLKCCFRKACHFQPGDRAARNIRLAIGHRRHPAEDGIGLAIDQHRFSRRSRIGVRQKWRILGDLDAFGGQPGKRQKRTADTVRRHHGDRCASIAARSGTLPSRVSKTDRMPITPSESTGATRGSTHSQRSDAMA